MPTVKLDALMRLLTFQSQIPIGHTTKGFFFSNTDPQIFHMIIPTFGEKKVELVCIASLEIPQFICLNVEFLLVVAILSSLIQYESRSD